jgi:hypothetical protein
MKTSVYLMLVAVLLMGTGCWETVYGPVIVNKTDTPVSVEVVTTDDRLKLIVPAQGNSWRRNPLKGGIVSVTMTFDGKVPIALNREEIEKRLAGGTHLNDIVILIHSDGIEITAKPKK